ncbi:hypothetical protein K402DRAFT_335446 [Aulographum hederae CBS 113979]|uniref:Uncharacterized protein n=1 Tax=Aulographum hederae CBS 113979 TaxID=1176131 RepID=A0A6G1GVW7_9PEZI|nr:hypothetical protein K402DRAFT_335446 [Aulographum hederae CBS 113979]
MELSGQYSRSLFERIVTAHPPVLESLLSQLPTAAVLSLFHTSHYLRDFLSAYPLAWKTLSFRLPQPALFLGSPGLETPDGRERQSKQYALDALLITVVIPFATCLTSLDLCNTAVSGVALVSQVLQPRLGTIQHLSVRGCKNVSIKYHIVPFLQIHSQNHSPWVKKTDLALKSLYTYRCRHHRRRPYLPSSLQRRDSDSEPTHELIELCHFLGIWTDTAWCPTPGGRCFRRKDYHSSRTAPGTPEVWVPFDRLWRSGNRIGPTDLNEEHGQPGVRLWEDMESGYDGEALGTGEGIVPGEGKEKPAHLRKSHKTFVEDINCDQCGDAILERCEQCSLRMHCMGCRKTLCASCAFNRPIPRKRTKSRQLPSMLLTSVGNLTFSNPNDSDTASTISHGSSRNRSVRGNRFWWAPGAYRSPNLMNELASDDDDSESDDNTINNLNPGQHGAFGGFPPKLNMHWCCLEPIFSGGGGIAFLGPGLGGKGADKIRAAPLPKTKEYEDPDFTPLLRNTEGLRNVKNHLLGEDVDILEYLQQDSIELQTQTCPRSLCQDCYRTFKWKVSCRACKKPLCKEHDFRGLKVRKCGYRDLNTEREFVRRQPDPVRMKIPAFVPPGSSIVTQGVNGQTTGHDIPAATDMTPSNSIAPTLGSCISSTPSRARSLSCSGVQQRPSHTMWPSERPNVNPSFGDRPAFGFASRPQLPGYPLHPVQWEGCGSYFCQQFRPVGDCRQRCSGGGMRECRGCGVFVCEFCLTDNPPCPCAVCTTSYHCPSCARKPTIAARCRRKEEEALRQRKQAEEETKKKLDAHATKMADEVAESVGAFFWGVGPGSVVETGAQVPLPEVSVEEILAEMDQLIFGEVVAGVEDGADAGTGAGAGLMMEVHDGNGNGNGSEGFLVVEPEEENLLIEEIMEEFEEVVSD